MTLFTKHQRGIVTKKKIKKTVKSWKKKQHFRAESIELHSEGLSIKQRCRKEVFKHGHSMIKRKHGCLCLNMDTLAQ